MGFGKSASRTPSVRRAPARPDNVAVQSAIGEEGFMGFPPLFFLLYGPPGIGKTSFTSHFPDVQYIIDPGDRGAITLQKFKRMKQVQREVIVAANWTDYIEQLNHVSRGRTPCRTVVAESLIGLERYCFVDHCHAEFKSNFGKDGFYSYGNGPKSAAKHLWPDLMGALQECNAAGINVILTGHSSVKPFKNPLGSDYDQYQVNVDPEIWNTTFRTLDSVLFYYYQVDVSKPDGSLKNKANPASARRLIGCEPDPAYAAKNQYGLPAIIEAGDSHETAFQNFTEALIEGQK